MAKTGTFHHGARQATHHAHRIGGGPAASHTSHPALIPTPHAPAPPAGACTRVHTPSAADGPATGGLPIRALASRGLTRAGRLAASLAVAGAVAGAAVGGGAATPAPDATPVQLDLTSSTFVLQSGQLAFTPGAAGLSGLAVADLQALARPNAVPEPPAAVVLGAALALLAVWRRVMPGARRQS